MYMKYLYASKFVIGLALLTSTACHSPSPRESFEQMLGLSLCDGASVERIFPEDRGPIWNTGYTYMANINMNRSCVHDLFEDVRSKYNIECHEKTCSGDVNGSRLLVIDKDEFVYVQYSL